LNNPLRYVDPSGHTTEEQARATASLLYYAISTGWDGSYNWTPTSYTGTYYAANYIYQNEVAAILESSPTITITDDWKLRRATTATGFGCGGGQVMKEGEIEINATVSYDTLHTRTVDLSIELAWDTTKGVDAYAFAWIEDSDDDIIIEFDEYQPHGPEFRRDWGYDYYNHWETSLAVDLGTPEIRVAVGGMLNDTWDIENLPVLVPEPREWRINIQTLRTDIKKY